MTDYKVVVDKSTVPVGTADAVQAAIAGELKRREVAVGFSVVSNPEFLKEGAAVDDFMRPDRVIIGASDERAILLMRSIYAPFVRNHDRVLVMDVRSAELTKYAANAMLATRISFMNELSRLADRLGADIEMVRKGMGSDPRIGSQFLYPGLGYGGSCFPKDVKALLKCAQDEASPLKLLAAVEAVNDEQRLLLVEMIRGRFGDDLSQRTIAVWGLAFKPDTDDMREAPSRTVIEELLRRGAQVRAYDPVAMPEAARVFGQRDELLFAASAAQALEGADALAIVTEWREFRTPDFDGLRATLRSPVIFDGRNLYSPATMAAMGIEYHCIGRPTMPVAAPHLTHRSDA